ncbi:Metalloenzyme, LuxS/M16 peptidase-like protein [Gigaspora rosea]|uniref:Metalloenzyme, LuxS/M16 peptidase-like protein n=1 Tax=Gigaspora rosea TaxID=44941 RepID=A0A397U794_9GLOM|nr:Metalloenzyme, LuxS/M16 peptidase-like protein [Gigaspora rosea]
MASFGNLPQNFLLSSDRSHAVLSVPIEKSNNDDRDYRLIRLSNDLEALLIHDPTTDKSSASLDVHVGNLSDPDDLQGLAHFCEHLLFMGTEKYPKENEYNSFLSKHSGHSNAYTGLDNTNYYFEVGYEFLEGALDRFAQFFIAPLFDPNCTDREILAVDSEHKKNRRSDSWRLFQLERALSNPDHPYSRFGSGNLYSLRDIPRQKGLDIRNELLKFHERYYSANLMKLVVLGRDPLDLMASWVVDKFSAVKNKGIPAPIFDGHPLTKNELLRQVFVKPVKDIHSLEITFPFIEQTPLYTSKPGRYLTHLIAHEGYGSILSFLKKKGWANYLEAGSVAAAVGFEFFKVSIDLTESGLDHYKDVVKIVFQYINMLKQIDIQEWCFREVQSLAEISFRFKEKSAPAGYASNLASTMQRPYSRDCIISGSHLIREYNPQLIAEGLECLNWDNFVITLVSPSFTGLDRKEMWYGTEYKVEPLSKEFIEELQNQEISPDLRIPPPNEFIPTNFETNKHEVATPQKRPDIIKNNSLSRMWHKKDDTFWVPKVTVRFLLKSPISYAPSPSHCVKTRLYTELVKDNLTEYSYNADLAGLRYDIETQREGILLSIKGYNDKLHILLQDIVHAMKPKFTIYPGRFEKVKERLQRSYKNTFLDPPHQHATYYLSCLTQDQMWTNKEKLDALENITEQDIKVFYPDLFTHLHIESLVHGNMFKDEALKLLQIVENVLQSKPLLPAELIGCRSIILPEGKKFLYQHEVLDPNNVNSAIEYYVQVGNAVNKRLRATSSLLAQIMHEPCFNQLRTKEQLGYIVFSGIRRMASSLGVRVIIQSEKDTVYLENKIEDFLNLLQTLIEEMPEEEYQKQVQSLITKKLEKPKNLYQEAQRYWNHIDSGYYDFDQVDTDVAELRTITKPELLDFYKQLVHPSSPIQKKLSVHLQSQKLLKKSKPIDVNHLYSCLSAQGLTTITIENLQTFLSSKEIVDGRELETSLKKFLIDQSKAQEREIEELIKNVGESYLMESSIDGEEKVEYGDTIDLKLRDLKPGNEKIDDIYIWKSNMQLGPAPTPVISLNDLTSKL